MSGAKGESKARLGVFVVSGLVLTVAGVLALGAARYFERTLPVYCYFTQSVQGLEPGSPVSYRGVQVGRVAKVSMRRPTGAEGMTMGTQALIEVQCDFFPAQLVHAGAFGVSQDQLAESLRREVEQGLTVRIQWKDITGQKYLDLDYRKPGDEPPRALAFRPEEPYIPTASEKSLIDIQRDLATTLGGLAKIDFEKIAGELNSTLTQLASKVSEFRADELSISFRDAARSLEETAKNEDLRRGLARLDQVTAEMEKLGKRANEILARPELDQGVTDLAAAAKSLRETSEGLSSGVPATLGRIDAAVDDARRAVNESKIPETTAAVRAGIVDLGGAARTVTSLQGDLGVALRDLSHASRSLSRLADYLERHPEALLRGRAASGAAGTEGGSR